MYCADCLKPCAPVTVRAERSTGLRGGEMSDCCGGEIKKGDAPQPCEFCQRPTAPGDMNWFGICYICDV